MTLHSELAGLGPHDKRKQSVYIPVDMLRELKLEADRQQRSLSWIVQQAWRCARREVMSYGAPPTESRAV